MIWLVGATGLLGAEVRALLGARNIPVTASASGLDITDAEGVQRLAQELEPAWVINCAAYTAVDQAEEDEARAFAVNAQGAGHLARAATSVGARLIHVSTDYVFRGDRSEPYPEDAEPDPAGVYGRSKAAGEAEVRAACAAHHIVRTAWLHGPEGRSFVGTMLRLLAGDGELQVVDDQVGSPTYAADLAGALLAFVERGDAPAGTYHYTNEGTCSWFAFAEAIRTWALSLGLLKDAPPVRAVATSDWPTAAPRPARVVLSKERIRATLQLSIPTWQDGLGRHLRRLAESTPRP